MNIIESFRIAWVALLTNKIRALLTMLGIIIGVGAVVGMLSIGNGLGQFLDGEFNKLGVGVFYVFPSVDSSAALDDTLQPQLSAADAEAMRAPGAVPAATGVVIEYSGNGVASAGRDRYFYTVKGITPSYFTITANTLAAGRYYNDADEQSRARVAVLGDEVALALFGDVTSAVGRRVSVEGVSFDVVGVLSTRTSAVGGFQKPTEMIYVPYQTARARLFRNAIDTNSRVNVSQITVQARSPADVDAAIAQVTTLLRQRHRLTYQANDFQVQNPEQAAEQRKVAIAGLNGFLGVIAGISLLVGGIGIMNIMLVSVTQRTREIGLRKAVGARNRDIMQQFLIEAVMLCLLGGVLGVALGYLMSFGGTYVLQTIFRAQNSQATVTLNSIVLATVVSAAIGIGFGFFPALRAARLNPIQALRQE